MKQAGLCMGCMEAISENEKTCPYCGFVQGTMPEQGNQMPPETILHGKYILGKVIGYGGFGVTYLAYDAELNMKVAIKEYMPNEFSGRVQGETKVTVFDGDKAEQFHTGLSKFKDEAKRLAKFENIPGIVKIFDSFEENGTGYLVMEYIDGETLKEKLKREKKLSLKESLGILLPILSSLKEIHKTGLIHRDIAPDNIMVSRDGEAKLIDFGASRFATATHSRSLTVLMKQGYAPVEQYNSRGDQGSWTDVYALGATFYKMLTGITPEDAMERKAHDGLKIPSKAGADCGKNVDAAIMNALNLGIEYRTKDMEQFEKELLSDTEVTRIVEPEHKTDVGRVPRWMKTAIGAAAVLLVCIVGFAGWYVIKESDQKLKEDVLEEGMTLVPNFINQLADEVEPIAENSGLRLDVDTPIYDEMIPVNMVCRQNVAAGQIVRSGDTIVYLTVSKGKEKATVPDLYGLTREEAIQILQERKLDYKEKEAEYSTHPEGKVFQQNIPALEQENIGTVIEFTVSKGNDPNLIDPTVEVVIPCEFTGMTEGEVAELLSRLKLSIDETSERIFCDDVEKGVIIETNVIEGDILHQGDKVFFRISKGIEENNIPDIGRGEKQEIALSLLREAGWSEEKGNLNIEYKERNDISEGKVISIDPAAGEKTSVSHTVTLVISSGSTKKVQTVNTDLSSSAATSESTTERSEVNQNTKTELMVEESSVVESVWSEWVDSLPTGVDSSSYEIETRTLYNYRDRSMETTTSAEPSLDGWTRVGEGITKTCYDEWGEWSKWTNGWASSSDPLVQIETRTVYIIGTEVSEVSYGEYGEWSDWMPLFDDFISEMQSKPDMFEYETRTAYCSKSKSNLGEWSEWTTEALTEDDNTFVRQQEQFRYKSRSKATQNCIVWSDEVSETMPAYGVYQTVSQYRTREKVQTTTTIYTYKRPGEWGEWNGWQETPISESETREVDTKIQYRYKAKG